MNRAIRPFISLGLVLSFTSALCAKDLTKAYEMPDATKILKEDMIDGPTKFTMPKSCELNDEKSIARGKYLFHNLNSKAAKEKAPEGLAQPKKDEVKAYGNCVACHNIEGAIGGGTVGPPLMDYFKNMIETKARDAQFVYQKIADPRVDNPETSMTVNLTTKMLNEQEVCDLTAYVLEIKKEKK